MANWGALDQIFFVVLPYLVFFLFFYVTIQRYRQTGFTYSSLSSQFLENKQHFWGLVPFHYGILAVLTGHIIAFLFPRELMLWNSVPVRLYILEISALVFALLTLVGLVSAIIRRTEVSKVRRVTTLADWIVYGQLLFQVCSGIYIAVFHPWGSAWFAGAVTPYLRSLIFFNPQIGYIAAMPTMAKLHIISAFLLIGFFPFTRLVHILVVPNPYLWRRTQVVRWYRAPGRSAT
jgi:nitrate reductase gamma subunit